MLLSVLLCAASALCSSNDENVLDTINVAEFINGYTLPEDGMFPASALESYLALYPDHKMDQDKSHLDPILILFNQANIDPECIKLLVDRDFPITHEHLMQAVYLNNKELYDIMYNGVDNRGMAVKDNRGIYFMLLEFSVSCYGNMPDHFSLSSIQMILESFKEFTPPDQYLKGAVASCNDKLIVLLLEHTKRISINLAVYAIETSKDVAVLSALLNKGLPVNYCHYHGPTPVLSVVSKDGDALGVFQRLVSSGANIDYMSFDALNIYKRALHQPDLQQRIKILLLLNKLGAKFVPTSENEEMSLMIGQLKTAFDLFKAFNAPDQESVFTQLPLELRSVLLDLFMAECLVYISRPWYNQFVDRPQPLLDDEHWEEISMQEPEEDVSDYSEEYYDDYQFEDF